MGCRERAREALGIQGTRPAGIFTAGTAQRYVNVEGWMLCEVIVYGILDPGVDLISTDSLLK